jgi:hypothetical protein
MQNIFLVPGEKISDRWLFFPLACFVKVRGINKGESRKNFRHLAKFWKWARPN